MSSVLSIKNLSYSYDKDKVLENINLEVKQNDFLAIIGPNGGGKSTLMKLIVGLLKSKKDTITILGEKPSRNRELLGYVPQNTNINIDFPIKVIEVVLMGHINEKKPLFGYGKNEKACAFNSLKQVGMEEYANVKIASLSGGQRQRVMIARALCSNPKILILDEPTASIDVKGQEKIYKLLQDLNKSITVIVVSHDISVILSYATKAAHINKSIAFHDISNKKEFNDNNEHFCEVELLEMLNKDTKIHKASCAC